MHTATQTVTISGKVAGVRKPVMIETTPGTSYQQVLDQILAATGAQSLDIDKTTLVASGRPVTVNDTVRATDTMLDVAPVVSNG